MTADTKTQKTNVKAKAAPANSFGKGLQSRLSGLFGQPKARISVKTLKANKAVK